ncbi:MAG: mannosyltransferase family protein [Nitrososphaerota archaeon]
MSSNVTLRIKVSIGKLTLKLFKIPALTPYGLSSALLLAFASRLFIVLVAVLGSYFLPIINPNAWDSGVPVLNLFARWDAGHYFRIAEHGYDQSTIGFFPLYPMLLRLLSAPLTPFMPKMWALNIAGFVLSNFFFFIAIVGLYRLTYSVFGNSKIAFGSCLFLSFFPTSVFFSAVYAESLTIALTLWAFLMLEKNKKIIGSLLAFLAGLSRPIGFIAFIPFFIDAIKRRSLSTAGLAIFSFSSIIAFDVYRYTLVGKSVVMSTLQAIFKIINTKPLLVFTDLFVQPRFNFALNIVSVMIFFLIIISFAYMILANKGIGYLAYSAALLIVYVFLSTFQGFPRYSLMIITSYWLLGYIWSKSQNVGLFCLTWSASLMGLLTVIFANWYELP